MRKISLVLMVLMLLTMVSVVAAQDVPCGDLAEEDCAILTDAAAAMASVDSATFTIDVSITTTTVSEETSEITISGDGAFSGASGLFSGMMMGMVGNPASAADMSQSMGMLMSGLADFSGQLNLTVDADGQELELQLVLVDAIGYINFGALGLAGMQLGEDSELPEWGGVNLIDLITELGPQMEGMMGGVTGGVTGGAQMPEGVTPEMVTSYVTITRVDDAEIDGVAVAVFETTIDFAGMMSDPAMQETIAANTPEGQEVTEEEMAAMMSMYENMNFTVTSYIGLDDSYLYGVELGVSMDMSAMSETVDEEDEDAPATVDVSFGLYFADHNAAPEITAPEGAVVAEVEDLMQIFGMFLGAGSRGS